MSGTSSERRGLLLLLLAPAALLALSADELIEKAESLTRGMTSHATMTLTVTRPSSKRTMKVEFWDDREGNRSLIVIKSPKKDAGKVFLRRGTDMWMYLPEPVAQTIRIPPSMMLNSWMGSDFTNDDLAKESSLSKDYTKRVLKTEKRADGKTVYDVEMTPLKDAPVVWGKVIYSLLVPGYLPLSARFYDEDGALVRTLTWSDVKRMSKRRIPTKITLQPEGKEGRSTTLVMERIAFDEKFDDALFDSQDLERHSR